MKKWLVFFRPQALGEPIAMAIQIAEMWSGANAEDVERVLLRGGWSGAWSFTVEPTVESLRACLERGDAIGSLPGSDTLYVAVRKER